jgi:hypothetical protein
LNYFKVEHTRKSSEKELETLFLERIQRMLRLGTTTIEAKSGSENKPSFDIALIEAIQSIFQSIEFFLLNNNE